MFAACHYSSHFTRSYFFRDSRWDLDDARGDRADCLRQPEHCSLEICCARAGRSTTFDLDSPGRRAPTRSGRTLRVRWKGFALRATPPRQTSCSRTRRKQAQSEVRSIDPRANYSPAARSRSGMPTEPGLSRPHILNGFGLRRPPFQGDTPSDRQNRRSPSRC